MSGLGVDPVARGMAADALQHSGTVTSVAISGGTTGLTFTGGPITTSGTFTAGGTLAIANGGTGLTAFGTGVATALGQNVSGSDGIALTTSPSFTTPTLGAATATSVQFNSSSTLISNASNTLSLQNGTTVQALYVCNTYTNSSNYRRIRITYDVSNFAEVVAENAGTGGATNMRVGTAGTGGTLYLYAGASDRWAVNGTSGAFLSNSDNNYDIGAVGANRPKTGYFGTSVITPRIEAAGSSSVLAALFPNISEVATVTATAATGTINYDITTQSVWYFTSNAAANWTINLRASSGTTLNTALATSQSITVAHLVTQGGTAYYNNVVQVDGTTSGVTTKWIGGAPSAGNINSIDLYSYVVIKTGSATFTVIASMVGAS